MPATQVRRRGYRDYVQVMPDGSEVPVAKSKIDLADEIYASQELDAGPFLNEMGTTFNVRWTAMNLANNPDQARQYLEAQGYETLPYGGGWNFAVRPKDLQGKGQGEWRVLDPSPTFDFGGMHDFLMDVGDITGDIVSGVASVIGAAGGAAAGTVMAPGVGTAAGGVAGGMAGAALSDWARQKVAKAAGFKEDEMRFWMETAMGGIGEAAGMGLKAAGRAAAPHLPGALGRAAGRWGDTPAAATEVTQGLMEGGTAMAGRMAGMKQTPGLSVIEKMAIGLKATGDEPLESPEFIASIFGPFLHQQLHKDLTPEGRILRLMLEGSTDSVDITRVMRALAEFNPDTMLAPDVKPQLMKHLMNLGEYLGLSDLFENATATEIKAMLAHPGTKVTLPSSKAFGLLAEFEDLIELGGRASNKKFQRAMIEAKRVMRDDVVKPYLSGKTVPKKLAAKYDYETLQQLTQAIAMREMAAPGSGKAVRLMGDAGPMLAKGNTADMVWDRWVRKMDVLRFFDKEMGEFLSTSEGTQQGKRTVQFINNFFGRNKSGSDEIAGGAEGLYRNRIRELDKLFGTQFYEAFKRANVRQDISTPVLTHRPNMGNTAPWAGGTAIGGMAALGGGLGYMAGDGLGMTAGLVAGGAATSPRYASKWMPLAMGAASMPFAAARSAPNALIGPGHLGQQLSRQAPDAAREMLARMRRERPRDLGRSE